MNNNKLVENEYVLNDYVYMVLPSGEMVVQTAEGIIKTNESRLKKFFIEYDNYPSNFLNESEINKHFHKDTKKLIEFLKSNSILKEEKKG